MCVHLGGAAQCKQLLAGLDIGVLVGLGLWWESPAGGPEIDQGLHWLQLVGLQHVESGSSEDEVTEATVEMLLEIQVVVRLNEVSPVKVGIDTEHLTEDSLTDVDKVLGETTALANPVTLTCELREGSVETGWTSGNWGVRSWGV